MNIQIKFRGIDIATGEMVFGGGIDTQRDTPVIINHGERYFVDAKTVGQFTGLLDKNGVEIYEGDVIRCEDGFLWLVEWSEINCGFLAYGEDISTINQLGLVIGNLHQNKELLK